METDRKQPSDSSETSDSTYVDAVVVRVLKEVDGREIPVPARIEAMRAVAREGYPSRQTDPPVARLVIGAEEFIIDAVSHGIVRGGEADGRKIIPGTITLHPTVEYPSREPKLFAYGFPKPSVEEEL